MTAMSGPLKVVPIGKAAPVEEVVEMCERLLARAKAGELRDLMWIAHVASGGRDFSSTYTDNVFERLGHAARILHRINAQMDEVTRAAPDDVPPTGSDK